MEQTDANAGGAPAGAAARRRRAGRTRNGLTPEQRRQQRRQALLDAGLELFGTKGYHSTTVEEVCRTAYVSTRNFYEEFDNREALLWSLVYEIMGDAYDALRHPAADGGPSSLRARVAGLVHAFVDDPRRARLAFVECRGASLVQEYRRRAAQQAFAQLVGEILTERDAYPPVSVASRETFALAVVGAVDLVLSDWVLQSERGPVPELIDSLTDVVGWMGGFDAPVTGPCGRSGP
jgi:AcrR family transcriptional regulator